MLISTSEILAEVVIKQISSVGTVISPASDCSDFHFTCSSSEGAILLLPDGASRRDLRMKRKVFRQYAIDNALRWYEFANEEQGRDIPRGSLVLVTGCDMAASWGVASSSGSTSGDHVELKFTPSHVVGNTRRVVYTWETDSSATVRSGPIRDHLRPIRPSRSPVIDETSTVRRQERQDDSALPPSTSSFFDHAQSSTLNRSTLNGVTGFQYNQNISINMGNHEYRE